MFILNLRPHLKCIIIIIIIINVPVKNACFFGPTLAWPIRGKKRKEKMKRKEKGEERKRENKRKRKKAVKN